MNEKFGDFLNDELIEVTELLPFDGEVHEAPEKIVSQQAEDEINKAVSKLISTLEVDTPNLRTSEVLSQLDEITDFDSATFDLVASKIVTDLTSRVALKGAVTQANILNRLWESLNNTYGNNNYPLDADSLLLIDKAFSYQDKLFAILDRYKKSGVVESLRHASKEKLDGKENAEVRLTTAELRALIAKTQGKEVEDLNKDRT